MGVGCPKNGTGMPLWVMSRSATSPTDSPRLIAARSVRARVLDRDDVDARPGSRAARNQCAEPGSATVSMGAVTEWPT